MKLLAWNCRGLSRASAICSLRRKIQICSPKILFLFKTKARPLHDAVVLNSLGFFKMVHAPPSGSKERLLLAWHNGVDLECILIQ
jgi:hypothetical protein